MWNTMRYQGAATLHVALSRRCGVPTAFLSTGGTKKGGTFSALSGALRVPCHAAAVQANCPACGAQLHLGFLLLQRPLQTLLQGKDAKTNMCH